MDLPYELTDLLRQAYSAERAAAFAYQGHAASVKELDSKIRIKEIENDEWIHRQEVLSIMKQYEISVSRWYEVTYYIIGQFISLSCYVIGWFTAMYFAGRLESGNVNEYYRMKELFHTEGITEHDDILEEMGIKEKEHEVFFLGKIRTHPWLPMFEKLFGWGASKSYNPIDLDELP
jgi:rubrerythrin